MLHQQPTMADVDNPENPIYSPFFGVMGASAAMVFSGMKNLYVVPLIFLCSLYVA